MSQEAKPLCDDLRGGVRKGVGALVGEGIYIYI